MISYIASIETSGIIKAICKRKNILILNSQEEQLDLKEYIKETKVNFNLSKYLIIDLSLLNNTDTEIIETIYNFTKLYPKTRIIILAIGYDEQNSILTNLYDLGFYNIINETENIESNLNIALSENGISKTQTKKFKKREQIIEKTKKIKNTKIKSIKKNRKEKSTDMPNYMVYLFSLCLEAVTRLVKFICYLAVFVLTSIGLTILLNQELRQIVFQIFGLK